MIRLRVSEHILFWENTYIAIQSVQLLHIRPGHPFLRDKLPGAAFLFLCQGKAGIMVDGRHYAAERFFLLHAGADGCLAVYPEREVCRCYLVEYRPAGESAGDGDGMPRQAQPLEAYRQSYVLQPHRPLQLLSLLQELLLADRAQDSLKQQTIAKGIFYRFIDKLLPQLEHDFMPERSGDIVSEALQYIELHYEEAISLELLAELTDSSPRHLSRQFKARMGASPIDYVIHLRMKKAGVLLRGCDAGIQEIAESLGYADSYAFSKMFKKQFGMPPARYRLLYRQAREGGSPAPGEQGRKLARTINTMMGSIDVPIRAERVVVLYWIGDVLSFGIEPVGVSDIYEGACFAAQLTGVPQLGSWHAPDVEAVEALKPDLIIVPSESVWRRLCHVAPTVCIPYDGIDPRERLELIGECLGRSADIHSRIERFAEQVSSCRHRLVEAGLLDCTLSIVEGGLKRMSVMCSKWSGRGSLVLYQNLGFKAPPAYQSRIEYGDKGAALATTVELLPALAGDIVIRSSYPGMDDLSSREEWINLPAVRAGRLIELDFGLIYYHDMMSMEFQLDILTEKLLSCAKR